MREHINVEKCGSEERTPGNVRTFRLLRVRSLLVITENERFGRYEESREIAQ